MEPINQELFNRTAPRWNCVDFPGDGMHYVPGTDTCVWCGMTTQAIKIELDELGVLLDRDAKPMVPEELGKYVCVAAGTCLHSPHITITSNGVWVRLPDSLNPGSYVYSSAHRDCYLAKEK